MNNRFAFSVLCPTARRKGAFALCLPLCVLGLGLSASAQLGTFTTIDAPGAAQGTYASAISAAGDITGYYQDINGVAHGFVRSAHGRITTFDAPGAGTSAYEGTSASAINLAGAITGTYTDANEVEHGYLRDRDGAFTTFDVPGSLFFSAGSIDLEGAVTGTYFDTNFVTHGFLRAPDGTITTIDAPGAGTASGQGTQTFGINDEGTVAGCYGDANSVAHGFLRTRNGTLTTFDMPDSAIYYPGCYFDPFLVGSAPLGGINLFGEIAGTYFHPVSEEFYPGNYRAFLRARDGSYTTFDAVPSPTSPCCTWTFGIAVNLEGVVAGYDNDYANINHGFVRARNGTITILDAPGAGTGSSHGTWALSINPAGQVAGVYEDASGLVHGFLWNP